MMMLYRHRWTNKMENLLRDLHRAQFSAQTIANYFNEEFGYQLTRNAIIGKIDRMRKSGVKI